MNLLFNYFGRINRAQFWLATAVQFVATFTLIMAGAAVVASTDSHDEVGAAVIAAVAALGLIYAGVIYSSICSAIKRFHDRGKVGWWIFVVCVPVIGAAWFVVECGFLIGTDGPNIYGPDPLQGQLRRA